jgi:hypothetical protein
VLALEYLRRARRATPETELKALSYINLGYQRLLTFEIEGGGFDWYGKPPANILLSAYGLLQLSDMAKVYEIDGRILDRTREFLFKNQKPDGSWAMPQRAVSTWHGVQGDLVVTSYIAWSVAESGYRGKPLDGAIAWIEKHLDQATEPYSLAMAANALASHDPKSKAASKVLGTLDKMKIEQDRAAFWKQGGATAFHAQGDYASVETTALAAYAMIRAQSHQNTVNAALAYLVKMKDARGTWGSTSATILSLRALLAGMGGQRQEGTAVVKLSLNGAEREVKIAPDQADVMQYVAFRDGESELARVGSNAIRVRTEGETHGMAQVVARYFIPWSDVREEEKVKPLEIKVEYDRASLAIDETLKANVTMRYRGSAATFMVIADLGIPPGFTVGRDAFEKMVQQGAIDRFDMTARQIILYFGKMAPGQEVKFGYELYPKYPIKAKTPKSSAYEYYSPDRRDDAEPVEIEVKQ